MSYYSNTVSRIEQYVLNKFIYDKHFERHINRTRKIYEQRRNVLIKALYDKIPDIQISGEDSGLHFIAKLDGKWHATPLLAALMVIEASDIMFAIDSVPAALSVSTNLFIVYTSNILAILGLRQLYFVLEHLQERFAYVRYGVAIILAFTGVKLAILMFHIHIPILASIGFIFTVLVGSILISIKKTK
jgi:tellurite resistance protein TerC